MKERKIISKLDEAQVLSSILKVTVPCYSAGRSKASPGSAHTLKQRTKMGSER